MSISEGLGPKRFVDLPQGRIEFRESGTGEPIVFVHGVLVNGDIWRNVAPTLAQRYRCIVPDWPLGSHSVPMRRDADLTTPGLADLVVSFLDALDLTRATLVGNDTGGAVCQLVVHRHPHRIERLVLASCDAYEVYPPRVYFFLPWAGRLPGVLALLSHTLRFAWMRNSPISFPMVAATRPPQPISDSYVTPGYRRAIRRDTRKVLGTTTNRDTLTAAKAFCAFDRPVLVAWAEDDKIFPQRLADRLASDFPNARRVGVPRSRTFIGEDQPTVLADLVATFMEQPATSRP